MSVWPHWALCISSKRTGPNRARRKPSFYCSDYEFETAGSGMIRNTTSSWGSVARAFHWVIGLTIIGMLAFGWWMNHIPARPDRLFYRSIHADIGYLLLVLMVLRLVWRWINPVPAMPVDTPGWERVAARAGHIALYAVALLVIMLGWAHSGAHTPDYSSWF